MVDTAPNRLGPSAPFDPVVERATGEEDDRGQGKDAKSYPPTKAIGDRYEG